jgi:hypothetical protein
VHALLATVKSGPSQTGQPHTQGFDLPGIGLRAQSRPRSSVAVRLCAALPAFHLQRACCASAVSLSAKRSAKEVVPWGERQNATGKEADRAAPAGECGPPHSAAAFAFSEITRLYVSDLAAFVTWYRLADATPRPAAPTPASRATSRCSASGSTWALAWRAPPSPPGITSIV